MAQADKSIILSKFEAGDRPTDQDFLSLFDSILFLNNSGVHANGSNTNSTSIEGNFKIEGNLEIGGTSTLELGNKLSIGNTAETVTSTLHTYSSHASDPVVFISGSNTDLMIHGVSGNTTSSIKLTESTHGSGSAVFGTHTGKAFIGVGESTNIREFFHMTSSNNGPFSTFSGSLAVGTDTNHEDFILEAAGDVRVSAFDLTNDQTFSALAARSNHLSLQTSRDVDDLIFKGGASTTEYVRIEGDTGNVGIGTNAPTAKLHVKDGLTVLERSDGVFPQLEFDDGTDKLKMGFSTVSFFFKRNDNVGKFKFRRNDNTDVVTIDMENERLGVGEDSPSETLHVKDDADNFIQLETTKTDGLAQIKILNDARQYEIGIQSDDTFKIGDATSATVPFRIDAATPSNTLILESSGKVGIGTTSPGTELEVMGDIAVRNAADTANNILLNNTDSIATSPHIQFSGSAQLSAQDGFFINIDSNANTSNAKFVIKTNTDVSSSNDELFRVNEAGQVSASKGFIGDGSGLTGITGGQLTGFVTNPADNRVLTSNAAGDAVIGEGSLNFDGTNLGVGTDSPEATTHIVGVGDGSSPFLLMEGGGAVAEQDALILRDLGIADENKNNIKFQLTADEHTIAQIQAINQGLDAANGGDLHLFTYSDQLATANTNQLYLANSGKIGIGTGTPTEKLSLVGNFVIRNDADNADIITFKNTDTPSTTSDVLFKGGAVISAENGLTIGLNKSGGTDRFNISTGDPNDGGEGTSNTTQIASFGTGSVGSVLSMYGGVQNNKPAQIQFNLDTGGLNNSGSDDGARIKYSTVDSQGGFYDASNLDFLVFEKLDSNNDNNPDGGILFTNSALGATGDKAEKIAMAIRGDGKIGIGTVAPKVDLHINHNATNDAILLLESDGSSNDSIVALRQTTTAYPGTAGASGTGVDLVYDGGDDKFYIKGYTNTLGFVGNSVSIKPTTPSDTLVLDENGRVGIGTDSPTSALHVTSSDVQLALFQSSTDNQQAFIKIDSSNADTDTHSYVYFNEAGSGKGAVGYRADTDTIALVYDNGIASTNGININSNGKVGIGTQDPTAALHIKEAAATTGTTNMLVLDGFNSSDITATARAIALEFRGGDANSDASGSIRLAYVNDTDFGDDDEGAGNLIFSTTNANVASDKMIITGHGRFGFMTTNPEATMHVVGDGNNNYPMMLIEGGGGIAEQDTLILRDLGTGNGNLNNVIFQATSDEHNIAQIQVETKSQDAAAGGTMQLFTYSDDAGTKNDKQLFLNNNGKVGIGTSTPSELLEVKDSLDGDDVAIQITNSSDDESTSTRPSSALKLSAASNNFHLRCHGAPTDVEAHHALEIGSSANGAYVSLTLDSSVEQARFANTGDLLIGTGSLGEATPLESTTNGAQPRLTIKSVHEGSTADGDTGGGIRLYDNDTDDYWDNAMIDGRLYWSHNDDPSTTADNQFYAIDDSSEQEIAFTGQHPCRPTTGEPTDYKDKVGYIVVADGTYNNGFFSDGVDSKSSPTINEALPHIKLSTKEKEKSAFGVISNAEDLNDVNSSVGKDEKSSKPYRERTNGKIVSFLRYEEGDERIWVNSLGEGAVMVSNINGNLENGDYITTSAIEGLGMKQDDDLLHNYTVAKITQDCDFSSNTTDVTHDGQTYKMKLVGCTYHCG